MQLKSIQRTKYRTRTFAMRLTENEYVKMQHFADLYAKGSMSGWLRHTGLNYKPTDAELAMTEDDPCFTDEEAKQFKTR